MRKAASLKNFVLLMTHVVRAGAKAVRYVSFVREVRLQNVVGVGFDAMKKSHHQ